MKSRNKFLLIIVLFFTFLLFFNIKNSNAYNNYTTNEDNTYFNIIYTVDDVEYISPNIPIQYLGNAYLIWHSPDNNDKEITISKNKNEDFFYINDSLTRINYSGNSMMYCNYRKNLNSYSWRNCDHIEISSGRIIVSSSVDVVKNDGTVFFQVPVQETTTIPALETVEQIPTTMAKVMKIIIPIGLTILGIGLLIYLIKQVIYLHL